MYRCKTYRNISAKVRFFGLEVGDWGVLAAAAGLLFSLSEAFLLNTALAAAAWLWMWRVKAKKPEGYTQALLSFRFSPRILFVETEPVPEEEKK